MKRHLPWLILFLLFPLLLDAQSFPARYWVKFKDKNGTPFSVSNPSAFLSQRAINRRVTQGITVTVQDLPVNPSYVNGVAATGATILNRSKWFNAVTVLVPSLSILNQITALSFVDQVQYTAPAMKKGGKPGQHLDKKWQREEELNSLVNNGDKRKPVKMPRSATSLNYGQSFNQIHMINGDYLHDNGYQGEGMVIAVIDAGFNRADSLAVFDSLWLNGRILGYKDFADPTGNVFEESSHGTMVLSLMGGNVPGQLIGTAPRAHYWLLRSEDVNSEYLVEEDNWVSAAEFADSVGADIINSSLGYTVYDDPAMSYTYADMDGNTARVTIGADIAVGKGMIVVNSAGNSGGSFWQYVGAPADGDSVFSIGAVDETGMYAAFSSTGPTADGRLKPDVATQGQGTFVASAWGGVFPGNGTSFSSPVMAGATACLWQVNPSMKNTDVMQAIRQSASQFNNPDSLLGHGIPNLMLASLILNNITLPDIDKGEVPDVYPNPVKDQITISFLKSDTPKVVIEIADINGRIVYQTQYFSLPSGPNSLIINLPERMSSGVFFMRIGLKDRLFVKKLVKL